MLFVCNGISNRTAVSAWKNRRRNEKHRIRYFLRDYKEKMKNYVMSEDVKQNVKFSDN